MTRVEFTVEGKPIPQGSHRAFVVPPKVEGGKPRAVVTNDNSGPLAKWRGDIRQAAKDQLPASFECIDGPVRVSVEFRFERPKSHYLPVTLSRPVPVLRDDAPVWHTQKPDADKCLRAVLDALTSVAYRDDEQVAYPAARKRWARYPGASIVVTELEDDA